MLEQLELMEEETGLSEEETVGAEDEFDCEYCERVFDNNVELLLCYSAHFEEELLAMVRELLPGVKMTELENRKMEDAAEITEMMEDKKNEEAAEVTEMEEAVTMTEMENKKMEDAAKMTEMEEAVTMTEMEDKRMEEAVKMTGMEDKRMEELTLACPVCAKSQARGNILQLNYFGF